jgi:hypothetical protein
MMCVVEISELGDATFERQLRGVKAARDSATGLDKPFVADLEAGMVEAFVVRSLSDTGPEVTAVPVRNESGGHLEAKIFFGGGLHPTEGGIAFETGFYGNNAFALNGWQFQEMYPERKDLQEHLRWRIPEEIAVKELTLHIQFPRELPLPKRFGIKVGTSEPNGTHWEALSEDHLMKVELQNVVQARISFPLPGAIYEISWGVPDGSLVPPPTPARSNAIARAQKLRGWLSSLPRDDIPFELGDLIDRIEVEATSLLGDSQQPNSPRLDVCIFAYDEKLKSLGYVAGSLLPGDPRRGMRYPFGLGAVGRAFKAADVSYFRPREEPPSKVPWAHILPSGKPVTDPNEVAESAILAIPLVPQDAIDWPYGVLVISTDRPDVTLKTTNTASDVSIEVFAASMRRVTILLEQIRNSAKGGK